MGYTLKQIVKQNSHSRIFKNLAAFGRAINRFYENRNHDLYSNGEETIIKKIAKLNPKTIFDVGANVGKYAKVLRKECTDSKIYCFEPVESTFNILKKNIEALKNIEAVNKGFYKENCSMQINLFESDTHSTIYELENITKKAVKTAEISLIKGDDFMAENNIDKIDFLKLDVEGAEFDAIEGFQIALKNKRIRAIQFEYGYINIRTKKLLIDFYEYLETFGYKTGKIFPKKVEFRKYNFLEEDFLGPNFIAVSKDDTEIIKLLEKK
jgi:FkbM family methyltransferase